MDREQIEPTIEDLPAAEATPAESEAVTGGIIAVLIGQLIPPSFDVKDPKAPPPKPPIKG